MLKFNSYYVAGLKIIYNFVDVKRQKDKYKYHIKLKDMNVEKILSDLEAKHPGEKEYLQAVKDVIAEEV